MKIINIVALCFVMLSLSACPHPPIPPEEAILITVSNGQVTAASYSPSDTSLPPERFNDLMTIEKLFQVIQEAITQQYDRLEVTYNATSGYPENIMTNPNEQATDLGRSYTVSNLH
ncbi:MAG: hypothetical protein D3922_08360 [Candidatus Electrothrix sp. AR1]|nr:hypothetical protein [Candidatus Electrothrix sp. AR1]